MDIRQLEYLVALARERHFTRAAAACNVTQPTLSGRIRQLEQELGVPIVRRGQRFQGFTEEGERVLEWARRIVAARDGLRDELAGMTGSGAGRLVLGVIPSALPLIPPLTAAVRAAAPQAQITILSQTSRQIARGLAESTIDAGVSYLDNEPLPELLVRPLHVESYCLFMRTDHPLAGRERIGWAEAAAHPLCLLTPDMQNRRIVDAAFRRAGARPVAEVESNSVVTLIAHVRQGGLATVLPGHFAALTAGDRDLCRIPLTDPDTAQRIGLITIDRDPLPRLVALAVAAAGATGS
ncbi:MAG: LysR family transcriptional regulator [Paracoccaceae bacterium]|nr:MAG: LysR family transcriptional regulator [Paracoccaceae bacterium]